MLVDSPRRTRTSSSTMQLSVSRRGYANGSQFHPNRLKGIFATRKPWVRFAQTRRPLGVSGVRACYIRRRRTRKVTNRVSDEPARYSSCDACHRCINDHSAKTRTGAGPVRSKNRASPFANPECLDVGHYRRRAGLVSAYSHNVLKPCSVRQSVSRQYLRPRCCATCEHNDACHQCGLILARPPMKDEK